MIYTNVISGNTFQTWVDGYLNWDPVMYGGVAFFTSTGNEVWTPDFEILNK